MYAHSLERALVRKLNSRGNCNHYGVAQACWSRYRTNYFHLFVCAAIVSVYGEDVLTQRLPHDEILLYFSSLAMHMDQRVVLKKVRGIG